MVTQFLTPGKRGVPIMFEKMIAVGRQFQELLFLRLGGEGATSRSNRVLHSAWLYMCGWPSRAAEVGRGRSHVVWEQWVLSVWSPCKDQQMPVPGSTGS